MLEHSPPLPLVIDYDSDITTDDEEGIILVLKQQRDRVLRVRLAVPLTNLQTFIAAMDEEYPILEYLIILQIEGNNAIMRFPETFLAPHLRQLVLRGFALPIGSRLLTTAESLVTLYLSMIHPSTYFHPITLLQWISFMPQLETLVIKFKVPIPNHGVEGQLTRMPDIAPVTLPTLRYFEFRGGSAYLEALVYRITIPRVEKIHIEFFNQLKFSIPRLVQLMGTAENLRRFDSANLRFSVDQVDAAIHPHGELQMYAVAIFVFCWHLDWQVSSAVQISNSLSQMFSAVEHLNLSHDEHGLSSEEHNEVDRTEWRKLLRPFRNVKTLRIKDSLAKDISRCLQLEDGELPLELLPELQELACDTSDVFTSFIDARQNAGRPVTLVRR
jgi:hypothetical protein